MSSAPKKLSAFDIFSKIEGPARIDSRGWGCLDSVKTTSELGEIFPTFNNTPLVVLCGPYGAKLDDLVDTDAMLVSYSAMWSLVTARCVPSPHVYDAFYKLMDTHLKAAARYILDDKPAIVTVNSMNAETIMRKLRVMPGLGVTYSATVVFVAPNRSDLDQSEYKYQSTSYDHYLRNLIIKWPSLGESCSCFVSMAHPGALWSDLLDRSAISSLYSAHKELEKV